MTAVPGITAAGDFLAERLLDGSKPFIPTIEQEEKE